MKKIVFLTGTRADYGKIKSLMSRVDKSPNFELNIFVTGMHMLSKYGSTYQELEKDGFQNIYKFVNQRENQSMDITLSNTIVGFSNYVTEIKPDLIVVHGDRVEALAGAMVGALNNIKVAHIEGGEVSGTIDESIRHAVTKFAHLHFVSNEEAKRRVIQLGEKEESIFVIGSPDIDIMFSSKLPTLETVKERYSIPYDDYTIFMYHPVTTEVHKLKDHIRNVVDALIASNRNYIVIYPNNDEGSQIILDEYKRFENNPKFKLFPSIRFENFLTLLKNCELMIGNSSAGVREASVYGVQSVDIGIRQQGRYDIYDLIIHVRENKDEILTTLNNITKLNFESTSPFGDGRSDERFLEALENDFVWDEQFQKQFMNIEVLKPSLVG
ncbi:UDP-N-acetylglucosamine 2-epimerase [Halalkalibacter okhensis]|uniref:UDP-N-acetylglucosamine 2-epimerase n=1 Tax=Halalkalibacter okhensis TaxID=333138 RepID=A0A0B0IF65_9BACI|nr:UDP-N-acetylglucosamine 2-epimerase [Halalkalibacter okhensis]KHF38714.1 UDP-N-acetylglucosamine 2-epimerase [Halalkalibacter okhensis]